MTFWISVRTRSAVDKALQRLALSGDLRRIDRGIYDVPRVNALTGQPSTPNYSSIIGAVTRREKAGFLPDGMTAANQLGHADSFVLLSIAEVYEFILQLKQKPINQAG